MLKKLNFPAIEKDAQPSTMVPKVSTAVQKRVSKLQENLDKLNEVKDPNTMLQQLLSGFINFKKNNWRGLNESILSWKLVLAL